MDVARLDEAVRAGDHDELLVAVDSLCLDEDWNALVTLREQCLRAQERGVQLWPIARQIEYRLALEAPGEWAAGVLDDESGRFTLGPLPEVAASSHTFAELAPHLGSGPSTSLLAHERVLRGEDLRGDPVAGAGPDPLELPFVLAPWEPAYALAEYHPHDAAFPAPPRPPLAPAEFSDRVDPAGDDRPRHALLDVVMAWTTQSDGRADATGVRGSATDSIGALGPRRGHLTEVEPATALAHVAWAGASGGAHGRRPGAAAGRLAAWWLVATVGGCSDDWPLDAATVGGAAGRARWFLWDAGEPETGWVLRVAVEAPDRGQAWALSATDARLEASAPR